MEFSDGAKLFSDLVKGTYEDDNAGVLSISPGPPYEDIFTLSCGTVALGDLVWVNLTIEGTKGATAGWFQQYLYRGGGGGSADVDYCGRGPWESGLYIPANEQVNVSASLLFEVTTAGALDLRWRAYSLGSNFTVPIGWAAMKALVIRAV